MLNITESFQNVAISSSLVADFFRDKTVLITGASGFVGKALLEKLLRSCEGIKAIYIILRCKQDVPIQERLEQLTSNPVFDAIRKKNASLLGKLHAIQGDITLPEIGLSQEDLELLVSSVNVVFHSAATVKFDEPLKDAVNINILGTRRILELCHKMTKLESLIHVSTAYAHCTRFEVDEAFYPTPVEMQKFVGTVDWMDAKLLNLVTSKILGKWPNTYTFTKAIAENLVLQESGSLPVAIIRPSIVNSAWREPVPGWVDNMNGPAGMIVAGSKGILRKMVCYDMVIDLVPVDIVINLMIVVAWHTSVHRTNDIKIFHAVADPKIRITWKEWITLLRPIVIRYPSQQMFRYPGGNCTRFYLWYMIYGMLIQHLIPGFIADTLLYLTGHKPRLLKVYKKLHHAIDCMQYFTVHQWEFSKKNVYALQKILTKEDSQRFSFDMSDLKMPAYLEDNVLGIRRYLMKEDPSTLPLARKRLQRLYMCTLLFDGVCLSLSLWFLSKFTFLNDWWQEATTNLCSLLDGNWF